MMHKVMYTKHECAKVRICNYYCNHELACLLDSLLQLIMVKHISIFMN